MSRRLRVAAVVTRLEGGAGEMVLRGARALDPAEYEVTIVAGSGGRLLREAGAAGLETVLVPGLRAPIAPHADVLALAGLVRLLARRRFDVVHTNCAKAGTLGRIAARRTGVPRVVHTYHGFPFHEFQRVTRRATYVAVERALGRITDLSLCVGTGVAVEALRRRLVPPERVRTIGVAVAPGPVLTPQSRHDARRALRLPPDVPVVGTVARLTYQKAPDDFVEALRALRPRGVVGVWVGGGELAGEARDLAVRAGVPLVFTGDRADAVDLLPAFDVFAMSSRYEGLPLAVVEAMRCGIPVAATAVNAVGDVVVPGETGLLAPPGRPELLAAAVARLLDEPCEALRMTRAAAAGIAGRHDSAALAEALGDAYGGSRTPAADRVMHVE
ncbi:glycosyltransferase [Saccharopolyspora erythraea]|uniref:glycosyltransferase n=1 Tax=Saccharopolyspora erythraea TaxID=1836 RepID=UPI001BA73BB6|nr:glycosyltransferase [Saccharopolyspora erythraea]QUH02674.1 glycosyltransferase [Saccharopolyspora erythraea]